MEITYIWLSCYHKCCFRAREPQPEIYKDGIWRWSFKIGDRLVPITVTSTGMMEKPKLPLATSFSRKTLSEIAYMKKVKLWMG